MWSFFRKLLLWWDGSSSAPVTPEVTFVVPAVPRSFAAAAVARTLTAPAVTRTFAVPDPEGD